MDINAAARVIDAADNSLAKIARLVGTDNPRQFALHIASGNGRQHLALFEEAATFAGLVRQLPTIEMNGRTLDNALGKLSESWLNHVERNYRAVESHFGPVAPRFQQRAQFSIHQLDNIARAFDPKPVAALRAALDGYAGLAGSAHAINGLPARGAPEAEDVYRGAVLLHDMARGIKPATDELMISALDHVSRSPSREARALLALLPSDIAKSPMPDRTITAARRLEQAAGRGLIQSEANEILATNGVTRGLARG